MSKKTYVKPQLHALGHSQKHLPHLIEMIEARDELNNLLQKVIDLAELIREKHSTFHKLEEDPLNPKTVDENGKPISAEDYQRKVKAAMSAQEEIAWMNAVRLEQITAEHEKSAALNRLRKPK